jgi:hypothetical protein
MLGIEQLLAKFLEEDRDREVLFSKLFFFADLL